MQVGNDQHHREQQDDGGEIDEPERFVGRHDPERDHGDRAYNGRTRAVNLQPGKFPHCEYEITGQENEVSSKNPPFRKGSHRYVVHSVRYRLSKRRALLLAFLGARLDEFFRKQNQTENLRPLRDDIAHNLAPLPF